MKTVRVAMLIVISLLTVVWPANAQYVRKYEAFGSFGVIYHGNYTFRGSNTGADFSAGFGLRPFASHSSWTRGLETEFALGSNTPEHSYQLTPIHYTASALYHFGARRVQPYALMGAGGYHKPGDSSPPGGAPYRSQNQFLGMAGAGVRVFVNDRVSVRGEYRAFSLRDADDFARASFGIGFHW